ncbi:MAG: IscS subfamily cysteine desulfurase [Gammaproteobacteria bacterium]|jgi:cysteine desulfurase
MQRPIYLDYAATTPVDSRVADKMAQCLTIDGNFGNPSSTTHIYGAMALDAVETARQQVADLINAQAEEIIWTSGATEANNLALQGAAHFYQQKKNHIITVKTEHKAVLDVCYALAEQGFKVDFLSVQKNGLIDFEELKSVLNDKTLLVSVMHVNNEIGVIQDIEKIGALAKQHQALFHVDAAQSAGRVPIDVEKMQIDLLSLSAHKMYGPKGAGVLYVRKKPRVRLQALMYGGGHQQGLRPGTLATHQIVGMGEAAKIAKAEMSHDMARLKHLRNQLWTMIKDLKGLHLNTDFDHAAVNFLNISFDNIDGEILLQRLADIAVSMGSACTSAVQTPSHVLKAIGISDQLAQSTLRITLGRFTSEAEIIKTGQLIQQLISS